MDSQAARYPMHRRQGSLPRRAFVVAFILALVTLAVWSVEPSLLTLALPSVPSLTWPLVLVVIYFVAAYLVALGERADWWTRKKQLNAIILVAFLTTFFTVLSIPNYTYGAWFIGQSGVGTNNVPNSLKIGNEPRMIFNMSVRLTGIGGLSAGKDIYMQVNVTVISPEGWNNTYCCLAIVPKNALILPPPLYLSPIPPTTNPNAQPFTLTYLGGGHYTTDGHFYVPYPTPIWVGFGNPKWNGTLVYDSIRSQLVPVANVTGTQSDALSVNLNEVAIKDSFLFGSFGFLAIQPVLVSLLTEQRRGRNQEE